MHSYISCCDISSAVHLHIFLRNCMYVSLIRIIFQEKLKSSNHANEGHSSLVTEQIVDRAPIIVSTNNQSDTTTSTKGKDVCKNNRSVIVRAGTMSVSTVITIILGKC